MDTMISNELRYNRLKKEWARASMMIPEVVRMLEDELDRMKKKNLSEAILASKELQITSIINFYNATEELVTDCGHFIRTDGFIKRMQNKLLESAIDKDPDRMWKLLEEYEKDLT